VGSNGNDSAQVDAQSRGFDHFAGGGRVEIIADCRFDAFLSNLPILVGTPRERSREQSERDRAWNHRVGLQGGREVWADLVARITYSDSVRVRRLCNFFEIIREMTERERWPV
jgi:hypothetical protein